MESECVPARKLNGEIATGGTAFSKMYEALQEREGPRPPGMICRHLCKNDSIAPNGFVCILHTTWGTRSENCMDRSPETRARGPKIAGKIGGKIAGQKNVESGWLKLLNNRPDQPQKLQVTCPHCGKTGQHRAMMRWHFDRCRHKSSLLDVP